MLPRLRPLEGKAGKHLPQSRNKPSDLHAFKSDGEEQPHPAQQKDQQVIPQKTLNRLDELGYSFHLVPAPR